MHPTACIDASAHVSRRRRRSAHTRSSARALTIGERAVIGAHCVIGDDASIGDDVVLDARVTVYPRCVVGARTLVHSGAVIGADGFGMAEEDGRWRKIPQIGRVVIGADVEIGANTTIDRGAIDDTVIEDDVKLDNQIQIGHNCVIGAHTAIAGCVGIAGIDAHRPQLPDRRRGDDLRPPADRRRHGDFRRRRRCTTRSRTPGVYTERVSGAAAPRMEAGRVADAAAARARASASARSSARCAASTRPADAWRGATMSELDIGMIRRLLPHRYPMLLVDRVLDWEAGKFIRGMKNVTVNEPFFQGHFPDYPVMPGVLVIEAMAQVAGLLDDAVRRRRGATAASSCCSPASTTRASSGRSFPGDTLMLEAHLERAVRGVGKFRTRATVGEQLVCEAQLLAAIRDVPPVPDLPV